MKSLYVKIALLGVIGVMHSASMCMLQSKTDKYQTRVAKKTAGTMELLKKSQPKEGLPLALPAQRPPMEPNFFTELAKEIRVMCVPSAKPNRHVEYKTRHLYRCQQHCWMLSQIQVSSTSRLSREVFLRDNPDLASYIRCSSGVRLEPNPTAAVKVSFERGLQNKSWAAWADQENIELSYPYSIEVIELDNRVRYHQAHQSLIKCSIQ